MKNLKRAIIVSFFVLLGFVGCFFVLKLLPHNEKSVGVYNEFNDKICAIEVVKNDEEPFSIKKENNGFEIDGLEKIPLNEGVLSVLFNFMQKIVAEHVFSRKENFSEYGLEKPGFVFNVKGENEQFSVKVGNRTRDKFSYYVLCEKNGEKNEEIAIVDSKKIDQILVGKMGYVDLKLFPFYEKTFGEDDKYNGDGVQECLIKRKNKKTLDFRVNEEGRVVLNDDSNYKVDESIEKIVEKAPATFFAKEAYLAHPSKEDFERFGLNSPEAEVEYKIDLKKFNLKIGNVAKKEPLVVDNRNESEANNGAEELQREYYYVYLDGVDVVYLVEKDFLPWLTVNLKN